MFKITVADFAKEHDVKVYQILKILIKIKKFTDAKGTISSTQAAFVRAELRKKDRAGKLQAPMSLAQVADRLVIPSISVKMPGIYGKYLAAFNEEASICRRINNNSLLRDLGFKPKPMSTTAHFVRG